MGLSRRNRSTSTRFRPGSLTEQQSAADLLRIRDAIDKLIGGIGATDHQLLQVARQYRAKLDHEYYYRAFTDALKSGRGRNAAELMFSSVTSFRHIVGAAVEPGSHHRAQSSARRLSPKGPLISPSGNSHTDVQIEPGRCPAGGRIAHSRRSVPATGIGDIRWRDVSVRGTRRYRCARHDRFRAEASCAGSASSPRSDRTRASRSSGGQARARSLRPLCDLRADRGARWQGWWKCRSWLRAPRGDRRAAQSRNRAAVQRRRDVAGTSADPPARPALRRPPGVSLSRKSRSASRAMAVLLAEPSVSTQTCAVRRIAVAASNPPHPRLSSSGCGASTRNGRSRVIA